MAKKGDKDHFWYFGGPISQQKRKDPFDPSVASWVGIESSKSRLAATMDRCEYLANSRNRFTEIAAAQTKMMYCNMNKTSPKISSTFVKGYRHLQAESRDAVNKGLSQSVPDLRKMLGDQRDVFAKQKTVSRRLDQLNKYVIDKEGKLQGEDGAKAAKTSSKMATPISLKDTFENPYETVAEFKFSPKGLDREWPLMAVDCSMPYSPPEMARTHGRKKDANGSTMSSAMSTARR